MYNISLITMEYFINIKSIKLIDISFLFVVTCKSDIVIDRTLCNNMIQLLYV